MVPGLWACEASLLLSEALADRLLLTHAHLPSLAPLPELPIENATQQETQPLRYKNSFINLRNKDNI